MIPLTKRVATYTLPVAAFCFVFLLGSLTLDLILDLSWQAGLVSSYYFIYFNAPLLFQALFLTIVAVAFIPVVLRIFINKMSKWDYVTVFVGIACYLIMIFLIFPSGWTVTQLVMHDLEDGGGSVLHLPMYQKDPRVQEALRLFRIGHSSLLLLCLVGAISQTLASRVGYISVEKYE